MKSAVIPFSRRLFSSLALSAAFSAAALAGPAPEGNPFRCVTPVDFGQSITKAVIGAQPVLNHYSPPTAVSTVVNEEIRVAGKKKPDGWKVRENSRGAEHYFTAASYLARLQGMPDAANPFRQQDGAFERFYEYSQNLGWGNGRSDEKSGALTYDLNDKFRLNVLEGGNLFGTVKDEGMWFGMGANEQLSPRWLVSEGVFATFGRGVYKGTRGGGVQFHYLLNPPSPR